MMERSTKNRFPALRDNDEMFRRLLEISAETEHFAIENPFLGGYYALMMFLQRYSSFIESVRINEEKDGYVAYVNLKSKIKGKYDGSYTGIEEEYTSDYYLQDCGGYELFNNTNGELIDIRLQNVCTLVSPTLGDRILDIGSGRGELSHTLSLSGAEVVGVDYSKDAVDIAKRTFGQSSNCRYVCDDVFQMEGMKDFNKYVMADVVEHIEQDMLDVSMCKHIRERLPPAMVTDNHNNIHRQQPLQP